METASLTKDVHTSTILALWYDVKTNSDRYHVMHKHATDNLLDLEKLACVTFITFIVYLITSMVLDILAFA